MRWRRTTSTARAKERANISFFIFIIFFAVFGVIIFTELLLLDRPIRLSAPRSRFDSQPTESLEGTEAPPPAHAPQDAVWQPVGETRFKFFVYSAYVERRTVAAIRIIAATKTRGADAVVCRLWVGPENRTVTLKARVKPIRENWNLRYSAAYVLCLLRDSDLKPDDTVGASVAVISALHARSDHPPTNLLRVLDTEPKPENEDKIHVCVKPFHFSYSRVEWLMEWFETNQQLGVSHFYMYNESLSRGVECLIQSYMQKGLVTLLPWKLPLVSKLEIRTEGQFAAFNDCLYRSMSQTGWLLVIDVDELVFPRKTKTLHELLATIRSHYHPSTKAPAALLFRNAFFYARWDDDKDAPVPLLTSRKTRRWLAPHPLKNRSKYVLRPFHAVELGNHFLWEMAPGATAAGVQAEKALLHHYRMACEFGGNKCLTIPSTVDRTAHRWATEIWERVVDRKREYALQCPALTQNLSEKFPLVTGKKAAETAAVVPTYKLNDGNEIPAIALGTSLGHLADGTRILPVNGSLARAVQWALKAGYRHIDTASLYRVEDELGQGVRAFMTSNNVERRDVNVTTKLWNDAHGRGEVEPAFRCSLRDLQLQYVDLYLMHFPMAYNVNPTITQTELISWCQDHGVRVMACSPFGAILGRKKDAPAPRRPPHPPPGRGKA